MCASPGGKSTHIAQLMKNEGTLISLGEISFGFRLSAADRSQSKADVITELAERLGCTCIAARGFDSTKLLVRHIYIAVDDITRSNQRKENRREISLSSPNRSIGKRNFREIPVIVHTSEVSHRSTMNGAGYY